MAKNIYKFTFKFILVLVHYNTGIVMVLQNVNISQNNNLQKHFKATLNSKFELLGSWVRYTTLPRGP